MFVGKHFYDITLPKVPTINKSGLVVDEEMFDATPLFRPVRSHIRKALMNEAKSLQEIVSMFTARKSFCEGLIRIFSPPTIGTSLRKMLC